MNGELELYIPTDPVRNGILLFHRFLVWSLHRQRVWLLVMAGGKAVVQEGEDSLSWVSS